LSLFLLFFLSLFDWFVFLLVHSLLGLEVLCGGWHWIASLVHLFVHSFTNFPPTQKCKSGLEGLFVACARCGNLMALVNPMPEPIQEGEGGFENAHMVYQRM
jgi:hypothetical protein